MAQLQALALSDLKLIRNFASVTVTENAANFEIVSYTLCNMPKSGANPVTSLDITFTSAYDSTPLRLSSFTVTYTDYQWN